MCGAVRPRLAARGGHAGSRDPEPGAGGAAASDGRRKFSKFKLIWFNTNYEVNNIRVAIIRYFVYSQCCHAPTPDTG